MAREQELIEFDPERIHIVKGRLDMIFRLQQKHQVLTVDELIALQRQTEEELESVSNLEEHLSKAKKSLDILEGEVQKKGEKLSQMRKKHAPEFGKAIEKIIHKLGIENGQIEIQLTPTEPQVTGIDKVEMLFSANKGSSSQRAKASSLWWRIFETHFCGEIFDCR